MVDYALDYYEAYQDCCPGDLYLNPTKLTEEKEEAKCSSYFCLLSVRFKGEQLKRFMKNHICLKSCNRLMLIALTYAAKSSFP